MLFNLTCATIVCQIGCNALTKNYETKWQNKKNMQICQKQNLSKSKNINNKKAVNNKKTCQDIKRKKIDKIEIK